MPQFAYFGYFLKWLDRFAIRAGHAKSGRASELYFNADWMILGFTVVEVLNTWLLSVGYYAGRLSLCAATETISSVRGRAKDTSVDQDIFCQSEGEGKGLRF